MATIRFLHMVHGSGIVTCADDTIACTYGNSVRTFRGDYGQVHEAGHADARLGFAQFAHPCGLAALHGHDLVVADFSNDRLRKVSGAGDVTTLLGNGQRRTVDGSGWGVAFNQPRYVVVRPDGGLLVAQSSCIRAVPPEHNAATTVAGAPDELLDNGHRDGPAATARFYRISGMATLPGGATLICDAGNKRLRVLSADRSTVTTLAGSGARGHTDGIGAAAAFVWPTSVAVGLDGRVVVVDMKVLRLVDTATAAVTTVRAANGDPLPVPPHATVAIDGAAHVLVSDGRRLYLVDLPSSPVYRPSPWGLWWRPTRARYLRMPRNVAAATRTVLAVMACLEQRERPDSGLPPPLPVEMWHAILGMIRAHEFHPLLNA